jgi:spore maturation protein SpmB
LITAKTWKDGFANGLKTSFLLLKVIIPVFTVIKVLEHTPVITWISQFCDPLMRFVGLPGEAALAVVTGMFLNFYAAVGIIFALSLTPWQITIVAVILSCCHELVIETAIINKTGIRGWFIMGIRLTTAFAAGAVLNAVGKMFL